MTSKLFTNVLLPLLLFSVLAFYAFQFIVRQSLFLNGLQSHISATCHPDLAHPYSLPYTGSPEVDDFLCGMVLFFHAIMDTIYHPLLAALFPAIGIVAHVLFLEAARDNRPFALGAPTPMGVLIQLCSMGVIMPIYALLFIVTGASSIRPSPPSSSGPVSLPPSKVNQANAEALLFGILIGYALPTALMLYSARPFMTAVWQAFPFLVALAALAHRLIRPPSRLVQSGHPTILVSLALAFVFSAVLHAVYIWPILTDAATLRMLFLPVIYVDPVELTATSLSDGAHEFIKWDMIFGMGSIMLATLWMADTVTTLAGIVVWYGIGSIAFGPAAAIAGVFLWRERKLNGPSHAAEKIKNMEKTE